MIYCIIGMPGTGKTLLATHIALTQYRDIASNYKIDRPVDHKGRIFYWNDVNQLINLTREYYEKRQSICILVDEANLYFSSRFFMRVPPQILWLWSQNRKLRIDIYYTTQSFLRVDKALREITNYIIKPRLYRFFGTFICKAEYLLPYDLSNDGITIKTVAEPLFFQFFWIRKRTLDAYNTEELIEVPDYIEIPGQTKNKTRI